MGTKWTGALLVAAALAAVYPPPKAFAQERRRASTSPEVLKPANPEVPPGSSVKATEADGAIENASAANRSDQAQVASIRYMAWESFSRVIIEVSQEVRYDVHRLQADPARGLPARIYIDVFGAKLGTAGKE